MDLKNKLFTTSQLRVEDIENINNLFCLTFNIDLPSFNYFEWKYIKNPFGDSLHVLTYDNDELVAVRSFWLLDENKKNYQCVDTCVLPNYQGKGIFKLTTNFILEKKLCFYNAPNSLSRPQYLKYGWKSIKSFKPRIGLFKDVIKFASYISWSSEVLQWRYIDHPFFKYKQFKLGDKYFIFRMKKNIPVLLGYTFVNSNLTDLTFFETFFCCSYDYFEGFSLEFGILTTIVSRDSSTQFLDLYLLDMF